MLTALCNTKLARILRKIHQIRLHEHNAPIDDKYIQDLITEYDFELEIAKTRIEQLDEVWKYIKKELKIK